MSARGLLARLVEEEGVQNQPNVATLSGDMDFTAKERLHASLAALLDTERALVDLSAVPYMDSSALSELVWLRRERASVGRSAPRIVLSPQLERIFEVAGLAGVFPLFSSLQAAEHE